MGKIVGYTFFYKKNGEMDSLSIIKADEKVAEKEFWSFFESEDIHLSYTYPVYQCEHGRLWTQLGKFIGCSCNQMIGVTDGFTEI